MKKFVAILKDKRRGGLTKELLNRHVEHLRNLNQEGKLLICGPFQDDDKALQILVCRDMDEAISLVERDPFIREGYYAAYDINELIEANEANHWLVDIPQTLNNVTE